MNIKYIFIFSFFCLICLALRYITIEKHKPSIQSTIQQLVEVLSNEQLKEDTSFLPPISFIQNKGLYKSYVKLNFFGTLPHTLLRRYFNVPDSNMFISNFVSLSLLEAWELGAIDLPRDQLEIAISAILNFKDKNDNSTDIYTFWLQSMGDKIFSASPLNLVYSIDIFLKGSAVFKFVLENIGMGDIYIKYIDPFVQMFKIYQSVFKIPSDTDDTSVNLALYAYLYNHRDELQDLATNWTNVNSHLNETLQNYLRYSYKPFSSDLDESLTDTRTYYYIRDFLKTKSNNTNFSLINTWLTNLSAEKLNFPDVGMPIHVNNIDLSVNTNSLFGLSQIMIIHPELITEEHLNLYASVSELVVWAIENEVVLKRPDIAILYYPSVYDFYWFSARVLSKLEKSAEKLPFAVMDDTRIKFAKVLREIGTYQIMALAKPDNMRIYWEDFLGTNDSTPTGEDRLFSTALAINMLIDTWTNYSNNSINWRYDTPLDVKNMVEKAIEFINDEILEENYEKENAFFSGSFKGNSSDPYIYPYNHFAYYNGSEVLNKSTADLTQISVGIQGIVDEEIYQTWLNMTWGQHPVPKGFTGFNEFAFPYWSSPAMTYGLSLMGLSKYQKIIIN